MISLNIAGNNCGTCFVTTIYYCVQSENTQPHWRSMTVESHCSNTHVLHCININKPQYIFTNSAREFYAHTWDQRDPSHSYQWTCRTDKTGHDHGVWVRSAHWTGKWMETVGPAATCSRWTVWKPVTLLWGLQPHVHTYHWTCVQMPASPFLSKPAYIW